MSYDNRLHRPRDRGGVWYFIGHVPEEVRHLIPGGRSGQKWISLRTKDFAEAKRRVRVKSVEFDAQIAAARRQITKQYDTVSRAEAERLARLWESRELAFDEEVRTDRAKR